MISPLYTPTQSATQIVPQWIFKFLRKLNDFRWLSFTRAIINNFKWFSSTPAIQWSNNHAAVSPQQPPIQRQFSPLLTAFSFHSDQCRLWFLLQQAPMQQLVLLLAALWITPCILTIAPLLETHSSRPQRALLTIPGRPPSSHNRPITLLLRLNGLSLCIRRRCNSTPNHQALSVGDYAAIAASLTAEIRLKGQRKKKYSDFSFNEIAGRLAIAASVAVWMMAAITLFNDLFQQGSHAQGLLHTAASSQIFSATISRSAVSTSQLL